MHDWKQEECHELKEECHNWEEVSISYFKPHIYVSYGKNILEPRALKVTWELGDKL